jgi:hypothetical protein
LFFHYAGFELLPLQQYFQIFLFFYLDTCLVDIDHLGIICKNGIKSVLDFARMRKYPLHNLRFMIVFSFLTTISFAYQQILLSSFFTAMVLHLVWDLLEDVVIFKASVRKYWI